MWHFSFLVAQKSRYLPKDRGFKLRYCHSSSRAPSEPRHCGRGPRQTGSQRAPETSFLLRGSGSQAVRWELALREDSRMAVCPGSMEGYSLCFSCLGDIWMAGSLETQFMALETSKQRAECPWLQHLKNMMAGRARRGCDTGWSDELLSGTNWLWEASFPNWSIPLGKLRLQDGGEWAEITQLRRISLGGCVQNFWNLLSVWWGWAQVIGGPAGQRCQELQSTVALGLQEMILQRDEVKIRASQFTPGSQPTSPRSVCESMWLGECC